MEKYLTINAKGCSIRAKLSCNEMEGLRRIIVAPHGFGGHKDNRATARFAEFVLRKYKHIGIVTYDQPCHGDDVRQKLTLADCDHYLSCVLDHCRSQLGAEELYCYSTSFGGYLSLLYELEHGQVFKKMVLRCPAVNMHEVLEDSIMDENERKLLAAGKDVPVGFDRKIPVSAAFLEQLREHDLMKADFLELCESIYIIQGDADEVVDARRVAEFADQNLIECRMIPGADHRFQNPSHMTEAIKAAVAFFDF